MNIKKFIAGNNYKIIPKELNEFNWGAFLLTFIWGIFHRAWITLLALPLLIIQLPYGINWVLFTCFQFYCGINGNKWAYQVDWWMKPADFKSKQIKWAITAVLLNISIPLITLTIAARFITKKENDITEYIQNAQCTLIYNKIKQCLPKTIITNYTTSNNLANQIALNFKNTTVNSSIISFTSGNDNNSRDIFFINIYKPNNKTCTFENKNCYMTGYFNVSPEIPLWDCKYYFNNKKQILPDEQTKNALKKGYNIFKYL